MSPGIKVITQALLQVDQVLAKADTALNTLQQQLTQVTNQRIGLAAQKSMLVELKKTIETEELANTKTSESEEAPKKALPVLQTITPKKD